MGVHVPGVTSDSASPITAAPGAASRSSSHGPTATIDVTAHGDRAILRTAGWRPSSPRRHRAPERPHAGAPEDRAQPSAVHHPERLPHHAPPALTARPHGAVDDCCSNPALRNAWYAVARGIESAATRWRHVARHAGRAVPRGTVPWSPHLTGARTARRRCRTGRCRMGASSARTTVGPSATMAAVCASVRRRPRAPATARAPASVRLRRALRLVWVCLGRRRSRDGIPVIAHEHDPAFRRINTPVDVWHTSARG